MRSNISLGRIFGVEVGLHFSWLLIALLITLSLSDRFHAMNPGLGSLCDLGDVGADGWVLLCDSAGA